MASRYRTLRGMVDVLPTDVPRWHFLERTARSVFDLYGYREIRTPALEATELFARSVGESSDIVRKEMYTIDRSGDSMTLRPENTAPVVRAFVQHSLHRSVATGYPERYYYIGPMFRHERPQKGRQRQFHQIGVELLGASEPLADAETIHMVDLFLDRLGIAPRELRLGSVGDEACRPGYRDTLRTWLEPRLSGMCEDCRRRYEENPLRVFDCKVAEDQAILADAPTMQESLCEPCQSHFDGVRRHLDDLGVTYVLDGRMVRGLDYYRRTVFEVVSTGLGAQNAILGGGRYDGLVKELGGPELPGFGFAMGMERALLLIPEDRVPEEETTVVLVSLGETGWRESIRLAATLRRAGIACQLPLVERPMGAQLKRADRLGAAWVVFVGGDEAARGEVGLKNMKSGEQVSVTPDELPARLAPMEKRDE